VESLPPTVKGEEVKKGVLPKHPKEIEASYVLKGEEQCAVVKRKASYGREKGGKDMKKEGDSLTLLSQEFRQDRGGSLQEENFMFGSSTRKKLIKGIWCGKNK